MFELTDDMKLMILTESVKYPEHAVVKYLSRIGDIQGELVNFKKFGDKYDVMLMVGTEKLLIQDVKLSEVELVSWPDICDGPRLIETTMSGYEQRTYMLGFGVLESELTEEEKAILKQSEYYVRRYSAKENKRRLDLAYKAFEQLRDIPDMPENAIRILREWTMRDEDEEDYEDD